MFETPCCRVHVQKIVHVEKRLKYKGETFFFRSIRLKFQQLLWRNNVVRHYNSFFEFYCWENMTKPFKCSTFQAHFLLHFIIVLLQNIRIHMCFIAFQSKFFWSYLWTFFLLSKKFQQCFITSLTYLFIKSCVIFTNVGMYLIKYFHIFPRVCIQFF